MTNLFNPVVAVEALWPMFENLPVEENQVVLAGGIGTDTFFGKDTKDVDVFVSVSILDRVRKFAAYYKFEEMYGQATADEARVHIKGGYNSLIEMRVQTGVCTVFKGFLLGYPVDIVVVDHADVREHVTNMFDMSIKSCYYNGTWNYSDAFMKTIETGKITPVRYEPAGYVRAQAAANKYGLEVGSEYELSKAFVYRTWKKGFMDEFLRGAAREKFVPEMFEDYKLTPERKANADLVSLMLHFSLREDDYERMFRKMVTIADKDIIADHGLHGKEFQVKLASPSYFVFTTAVRNVILYAKPVFREATETEQALINDMLLLAAITKEQFVDGKMTDDNGRSAKIGKFIQKVMRKHQEILNEKQSMHYLHEAKALFDTREASSIGNFYITGNKHSLVYISTRTKWSSCQGMYGFMNHKEQNYGLLANVSGATLVGYFADERCDTDTSKWHARILLRVGKNNQLILENVYSNRAEYQTEDVKIEIQKELAKIGWTGCITQEEARHFKGYDLWSRPYCDYDAARMSVNGDVYKFKGRHKQLLHEEQGAALRKELEEFVMGIQEKVAKQIRTQLWQKDVIVRHRIPTELHDRIDALLKDGFYYFNLPQIERDMAQSFETDTHMAIVHIEVEEICEGVYVMQFNTHYEKKIVGTPGITPFGYPIGQAVMVPARMIARRPMPGADLDGDLPIGNDPFRPGDIQLNPEPARPVPVFNENPFAQPVLADINDNDDLPF